MKEKSKGRAPHKSANRGPSERPLVPHMPPGPKRAAMLEQGAVTAAQQLQPAQVQSFYLMLVLSLWILLAKVSTPRGQSAALQKKLSGVESVGGRRTQDLACQHLLFALHEQGTVQTADRKAFRRDPSPLYKVTKSHLRQIAERYESLRALMRRFSKKVERPAEELFTDQVSGLLRLLESNPELEPPTSAPETFDELTRILAGLRAASTKLKRIEAPRQIPKSQSFKKRK